DPHWYDYPSLLMYVLAPVQALCGHASFGAARAVAVALGLGGVAAAWWLGRRAYGRGAGLLGAATVAVATTHVAYSREAVTDVPSHVNRLARAGWLGFEHDSPTPVAYLDRLWGAIGPVLVLGLLGLCIALWRRSRTDLVLASFALVYWLTLMPQRAHFDRYIVPLVPVLGVLAARARPAVPLAFALLVVPLVWSIGDARRLTH